MTTPCCAQAPLPSPEFQKPGRAAVQPGAAHRARRLNTRRAWAGMLAAAALLAGFFQTSQAQQPAATGIEAEAALSSELTDRGLSIGPRRPVAQGLLTFNDPAGWSVGLGASMHSQGRDTGRLLARASRYAALPGDWQIQAGLLYYAYTSSAARAYDRAEANLGWTYRDTLSLGLSASRATGSRAQGSGRLQRAVDVGWRWPVTDRLDFSSSLGHADLAPYPGTRYTYGHAGLDWHSGPWRLELNYVASDDRARRLVGDGARPRWSATVARSLF
jgi:uncharacterized protein (TIGR02001 family)